MAPSPCPGAGPQRLLDTRSPPGGSLTPLVVWGQPGPSPPGNQSPGEEPDRSTQFQLSQYFWEAGLRATAAWAGLRLAAHSMDPALWKDWLGWCLFIFVPFRLTKPSIQWAQNGHWSTNEFPTDPCHQHLLSSRAAGDVDTQSWRAQPPPCMGVSEPHTSYTLCPRPEFTPLNSEFHSPSLVSFSSQPGLFPCLFLPTQFCPNSV